METPGDPSVRPDPSGAEGPARWNDPDQVERFALRDADHRLVRLASRYPHPVSVPVLDVGCAGGRNTDWLARKGFDVWALDLAEAMVARTRARLAPVLGAAEAARRVVRGTMTDLSAVPRRPFALVVALGVFHQARDEREWDRALDEAAEVLVPGGLCLVSVFAPGTVLDGLPPVPVRGSGRVVEVAGRGRLCLVDATSLDADMAARGLAPEVSTATVVREEGASRRVTVNALYARRPMP